MLVNDLSVMEQIVQSNNNLFWYGWDVVQYKRSDRAIFDKDGAFLRNKWHKKTVFKITEKGWEIPKSLGAVNV